MDEADIIKTDGRYIYTLSNNNLIIVKAYPAESSEILSTTNLDNFRPIELFLHEDRLLVFGNSNYNFERPLQEKTVEQQIEPIEPEIASNK